MGSAVMQNMMRNGGAPAYAGLLPNPFIFVLPRTLWGKYKEYFGYVANFLPLAASAGQTVQTTIQNDSAFCIVAATAVVTDSPADSTQVGFEAATVQLQDQTTGRTFFSDTTQFHNVFGSVEQPNIWTLPRLISPGATLATTINNVIATAVNIRVVYHGFKIFKQDVQEVMSSEFGY